MKNDRVSTAACVALIVSALACSAAHAHHGYSLYDRCTSVSLEGDIASIEWANPHIVLGLKTSSADYRVEWFTLDQLARAGLTKDALKQGDHVVITGKVMRDPAQKVMSLVTEIRRPSDGFIWTQPPRPVPAQCARQDEPAGQ